MTSTQYVAGGAPLTFTNSLGEQRSVPLSAFEFSGSSIILNPSWVTAYPNPQDQAIMLALAQARATTGDLAAPPVRPPAPALSFTAAQPGTTGNGITVNVAAVSTTAILTADITIDVTETDTFSGLASGTAAQNAIGTDVAPTKSTDPPLGTGVLVVKSGSAIGTGLPEPSQSFTKVTGPVSVLAADGTTTLFELEPRAGYTGGTSGEEIDVTVDVDTGGKTFTVTSKYAAHNTKAVTAAQLSSLPATVTFVVTAAAPPSGLALPAIGSTVLSGGATGLPATGTAYTS